MKSKCPACARPTSVPSDLLDFLVRCDYCGAILRAKVKTGPAADAPDQLILQALPVGRLADAIPIVRVSVVDLLTRAGPVVPSEPTFHKLPAPTAVVQAQQHAAAGSATAVLEAEPEATSLTEEPMPQNDPLATLASQNAARASRAKAFQRAKLKSSHFALGLVSAVTLVLLLTIGGGLVFAYSRGAFKPRHAHAQPVDQPTQQPTSDGQLFEETKIK